MSAAPESPPLSSHLRLARPTARTAISLRNVQGLDEVERFMWDLSHDKDNDRAAAMADEHLQSGGKRIRARLALCAARQLAASRTDAVAWAGAVELLHNATLIHDDIQDGDRTRRGQRTVWARYGVDQAINVGDFMLMLPYLAVGRITADFQGDLAMGLAEHAIRTVRGQIDELDLLPQERLDRRSYLAAVEGKTGALIGLPIYGAAVLAGRARNQAQRISDAFSLLGVLFQLQDDVLDLYGDKGRNLCGSDLYEGKVSALVVEHLARRPGRRPAVLELLRLPREETSPARVAGTIEEFRGSGALDAVLDLIRNYYEALALHPVFDDEPALRPIAIELAQMAIAPISHLISLPVKEDVA